MAIGWDDVINTQFKAKLWIKQIKSKGESIETFQDYEDTTLCLIRGLDNVNSDIIHKSIQCSKENFEDYLHNPNHKVKFLAILDKLGTIDPGFTFNFCMDNEKKITSFVWITSVMRLILYQFGSFINVDFMKRKVNVHIWPYIGPVVMNDLKKHVLFVNLSC